MRPIILPENVNLHFFGCIILDFYVYTHAYTPKSQKHRFLIDFHHLLYRSARFFALILMVTTVLTQTLNFDEKSNVKYQKLDSTIPIWTIFRADSHGDDRFDSSPLF